MRKVPVLETDRLQLRELTLVDADAMFRYFVKEPVIRYFGMDAFQNIEEVKNVIRNFRERYEEGSAIRWGIVLKGTGQLIGTCGFHLINHKHKRAEIGYELDETYWGKGYATEALQAILTYGFETLYFKRISAVVYPENESSRKLLQRAGFTEEGLLRKYMIQNEVAHDAIMYSLLQEEWATLLQKVR
ncbi:GNAT family N-acetyltransferase [Bacillus rhizoplanae]|uniref:GNAT family N-acetyltransferase n=1 Tax=Bacillus rhizoplanae TaxID=2880966 RepID=UPI003D19999B